jgi:hypothetical protein
MKVEKKSFEQHPEGWHLFLTTAPEETDATYNGVTKPRLKWPCVSVNVKTEDGQEAIVNLFTGVAVSDHPMDLHRKLIEDGLGMDVDEYDDTDMAVGKLFAGKVEHKKETGRANIVAFDTPDRIKPKSRAKKAERDPFEDGQ